MLRLAILVKLDYSVLIMEVARRPSLWRVEPRFDKKVKRGKGEGGGGGVGGGQGGRSGRMGRGGGRVRGWKRSWKRVWEGRGS